MSKTVYILGAGFSKCAGAPLQNKILSEILSLDQNSQIFEDYKKTTKTFLKEIFFINNFEELKFIDLEDVLTIIDKAILNRESISKYSFEELTEIRKALNGCIVFMFNEKLRNGGSFFYEKLANKIINKKLSQHQTEDENGFIYLNWDIVLDNYIFFEAEKNNWRERHKKEQNHNYKPKLVHLDYCCYTTPYEMDGYSLSEFNVRSIDAKAKGFYNIKVQKLHGSFNWLTCNNCGRLFYKLGEKLAIRELFGKTRCPSCGTDSLKSLIITPTLLKDLNNTHLKMVWHNALLDLMEAKNIVFVGYSFPLADFELRYLLKRGIQKDANIDIVLTNIKSDKEAFERYKRFFGHQIGNDLITVGAQNYFAQEFGFECKPEDCKENIKVIAGLKIKEVN